MFKYSSYAMWKAILGHDHITTIAQITGISMVVRGREIAEHTVPIRFVGISADGSLRTLDECLESVIFVYKRIIIHSHHHEGGKRHELDYHEQ